MQVEMPSKEPGYEVAVFFAKIYITVKKQLACV